MSPISDESFQSWLNNLAGGDPAAAERLWAEYFDRLVSYARRKLDGMPRRMADEEDVALSALNSLCEGLEAGRFAQLADRDELWKLLLVITARKATAQRRRHLSQKRGGGQVRGESVFYSPDDDRQRGLNEVLGAAPSPELLQLMLESCRQKLDALGDETLRQVALLKLEGYSNEEIAQRLDCVTRTVERKLERIRSLWSPALADDDDLA